MELSETTAAPLSVDALLQAAVDLKASDLHLTAGSHPAVRVHGHIQLLEDFPVLDPDTTRAAHLPHHDDRAAEADGAQPPARLRLRDPRARPLPRQRLLPARVDRGRVPHHPHGDQEPRGARPAVEPARVHGQASRPRARHRPDRLGQVDDARLARSTRSTGSAPITSSRSRTRSSSCTTTSAASSTSARSATTPRRSPTRCAPPCVRTPT